MYQSVSLLLAALLAGSCASPAPRAERSSTAAPPSAHTSPPGQPAAIASAAPSSAASLPALLAEIKSTSPLLAASEARAATSREGAEARRAARRGEVDTFAQAFQYDSDRLVNPISGASGISPDLFDDQQYGIGLEGRLPLDINRRIKSDLARAEAQSAAAEARTEALWLQLAGRTSSLYRGLEAVAGSRGALEAERVALDKHLKIATKSVEIGRLEEVERIRIRAARDAVVGRLAELDGRESSLRAALTALLHGRPFAQPVPAPAATPGDKPSFQVLLEARPDIRALASEVKAAAHAADAAAAQRRPELNLIGGLRWNSGFDADGDTTAEIGLKLTWPAYDGGLRGAKERAARHNEQARRLELAGALDAADGDVLAAEARWQAASAGYTAALSGLEAATEAARVQRERFEVGRLSSTDLLDAEARLAEAQDNLTRILSSWWSADDALFIAHGQDPRGIVSQ